MSVTSPTPITEPKTDTPSVTPKATTSDKPKVKKASTPKKASGRFTKDASLSQVVQAVATLRQIDTTRAGKLVRSHIRANYERYAKGTGNTPKWAALVKAKDNRDGNRYPAMPPSVANSIVGHMTAAKAK